MLECKLSVYIQKTLPLNDTFVCLLELARGSICTLSSDFRPSGLEEESKSAEVADKESVMEDRVKLEEMVK